jgi:hypothetical protein
MRAARVAVHVHSTWSYDGRLTLDEVARTLAGLRYDAVMMCEHDTDFDAARWEEYRAACARAGAGQIALIPGIEYGDADNTVHVPVWGAREFLGDRRPTLDLLKDARAAGAAAVLAHPDRRRAHELVTDEWLSLVAGVEVWNRKYDGVAPSRSGLALLERAPNAVPTLGLDLHARKQLFPFWLRLPAHRPLDERGVADALLAGERHVFAGAPARMVCRRLPNAALGAGEQLRRRLRKLRR